MKITEIRLGKISIPLKRPFKTALRTVKALEDVIVEVHTDTGNVGYGEAAPTGVITGDTTGAIVSAIQDHIAISIVGREIADFEEVMLTMNASIAHNTSAKAAVDMALWDLFGQLYRAPVYRLLGGKPRTIITDQTISVNAPDEMVKDSLSAVKEGFQSLKIKVGKNSELDLQRLRQIREAIGENISLRIDANQGWRPREAVKILQEIERAELNIELVEQPVKANDLEGLKYVHDHTGIPILADESVFSAEDALRIIQIRAADYINIKLMKTGGIYNALKIINLAEIYEVECLMGCMLEAKISVTAASHLMAARSIISRADLDGPNLCKEDPVAGGVRLHRERIELSEASGLGIECVRGLEYFD